jgi:hypothetical protein
VAGSGGGTCGTLGGAVGDACCHPPPELLDATIATNPLLCTDPSEVNTIVSEPLLELAADAATPESVASTVELAEPPS